MTESRTAAPIVRIDWPFGAPSPSLHCPRSGRQVISAEEGTQLPPSPYVTFVYLDEISEFDYLREDLRERIDAAKAELVAEGADPDDLNDLDVLLDHTDMGEVPLVYEIHTSGMACGPVNYCVRVGFDLWREEV